MPYDLLMSWPDVKLSVSLLLRQADLRTRQCEFGRDDHE